MDAENKKQTMKIETIFADDSDEDADDTYGLCSVTVARQPVTLVEEFESHINRKK